MKKIALIALLTSGFLLNGQTVSNDFESGNRSIDQGNCWGFGGFSVKTNQKINGSYSARSGSINNTNGSFWLHSPWIKLTAGNITFDTRLTSDDGSRNYYVEISFIPYDANASFGQGTALSTKYTHTYTLPHSTPETVSYPVPASIADDGNPYKVRLSFYNQSGNRNRRAVVDDWSIPGTYSADPSNNCLPLVSVADADSDGVPDDEDEYPNDPDKAYNSYFPASGTYGTIAFEDLWPSKGDYDFNDLVVDYNANYVLNASNEVVEMNTTVYVRAVGAGVINAFGIQYPSLSPSDISSVTGYVHTDGYINLSANGTEVGQTNAVIIPFDNVESVINRVGGAFYNTVAGEGVGQSDSIKMKITFSSPQSLADASDIDPFMIKGRDRTMEVHLPDKAPTDLANVNILGTGDDDSNPGSNRYYKTVENYPWAILVPRQFVYPAEKNDIVTAHTKFAAWAQSSGGSFTNWYEDESGYRDPSKLFQ